MLRWNGNAGALLILPLLLLLLFSPTPQLSGLCKSISLRSSACTLAGGAGVFSFPALSFLLLSRPFFLAIFCCFFAQAVSNFHSPAVRNRVSQWDCRLHSEQQLFNVIPIACHTSHVTHHTSHATHHTSHVNAHTPCITRHLLPPSRRGAPPYRSLLPVHPAAPG